MSGFIEPQRRNLIPRWRRAAYATELRDLSSLVAPEHDDASRELILRKLADWRVNPTIPCAVELIGAGIVTGQYAQVEPAAQFVLSTVDPTNTALRRLASGLIDRTLAVSKLEASDKIHDLRTELSEYPHNPVMWCDLALLYTNQGLIHKARKCLEIALGLSPSSRFVIRSAVRFFLHSGDVDRAHYVLLRTRSAAYDPWLISAELAVSAIRERSPEYLEDAREMLSSERYSAHDTSELASQLATKLREDGRSRDAKKLFTYSLKDPTENSFAQARWIYKETKGLQFAAAATKVENPFEALALDAYYRGDWKAALSQCRKWQNDEQFASRPAVMGSFIASTMLGEYSQSAEIAHIGLRANPRDFLLINNLAFASLQCGQIEKAERLLKQAHPGDNGEFRATRLATEGLLLFRSGKHLEGRLKYEEACQEAAASLRTKRMALLHLAYEEWRSNPGKASDILRRAFKESESATELELVAFRNRLKSEVEAGQGGRPTL